MSLDQLGPQFDAHKGPILATAAAGVVGFALYQRHKATTAAPAGPAQGVATAPASAGGQLAGVNGAAAYDSSASDIYGLVQPQLESLGGQLTDLKSKLDLIPLSAPPIVAAPPAPAPTPAPAPYAAPAPSPIPISSPAHAVDTWVTVNKNDTLSGIAARFPQLNITASTIGRDNGIANINRITPGQKLHILG
jgi:nucleoid-associated protein YgaU